ncbi:MAG: hypothetical protein DI628_00600 [Blastochloris viridis]|uniref:Uncharacterized protein n=1 Tax=Blastochloris viridis TaxID=1079 RepID=A0A6N4RAQ8_BLAVI|nr:MAG: hypothetical protein DI628_00600 [Blastochloris viridis]
MKTLSQEVGISDVGLAKICKKLGVRRPPQGYWNKVTPLKKAAVPELLKGSYPSSYTVKIHHSIKSETFLQAKAKEQMEDNIIIVPPWLSNPHPWIKEAKKKIDKSKESDSLINLKGKSSPNITVSRHQAERAFRIFDTLLKALATRKMRVWLESDKTWVKVDDEIIEIGLREMSTRRRRTKQEQEDFVKANPHWYRTIAFVDEPNGKLEVFLKNDAYFKYSHRSISEANGGGLEGRINGVIIGLHRLAANVKIAREESRLRSLQHAIDRQKWEEEDRIRQLANDRMTTFTKWSDDWHRAKQLESFLHELEALVKHFPEDHEVHAIVEVAKARIEKLNPLLNNKILDMKKSLWNIY